MSTKPPPKKSRANPADFTLPGLFNLCNFNRLLTLGFDMKFIVQMNREQVCLTYLKRSSLTGKKTLNALAQGRGESCRNPHQSCGPSIRAPELDSWGPRRRALGLKLWTVGACAKSVSEPRPPDKIDFRSRYVSHNTLALHHLSLKVHWCQI